MAVVFSIISLVEFQSIHSALSSLDLVACDAHVFFEFLLLLQLSVLCFSLGITSIVKYQVQKFYSHLYGCKYHQELIFSSSHPSDTLPDRYPLAELPAVSNDFPVTCLTTGLVWDVSLLPSLHNPTSPSTSQGPLDLSSPSSSVSCSSSGEEDEGRTSDPPSPDSSDTYHPQQTSRPRRNNKNRAGQREDKSEATVPVTRPAFFCKHCPKEYNSLGALKMHIRSHTLPCVCPTCGKAFSRPWLLRGHIRTHTGKSIVFVLFFLNKLTKCLTSTQYGSC